MTKVNRRDAMAIAAAGTVGAMFPVAEPEMYPEPELLPAFTSSKDDFSLKLSGIPR